MDELLTTVDSTLLPTTAKTTMPPASAPSFTQSNLVRIHPHSSSSPISSNHPQEEDEDDEEETDFDLSDSENEETQI